MHTPCLAASVVALVVPLLPAQTGSYTTFGSGCAGSGSGPGCISSNYTQQHSGITGSAANFAVLANTGSTPRLICRFEFFCKTVSNQPTQTNAWIYDRTTSGQPGQILHTTTIQVGGTANWYAATVTPPLILQPNTDFFLVIDNRVGLNMPLSTGGTPDTYYWNGPPTWNGPFSTRPWMYNVVCCGGGSPPALSATGVPSVGKTFRIDLAGARPSTAAGLMLGASNTLWGAIPLPLDLTPLGAAGCSLLVSVDVIGTLATDASGGAAVPFAIPNDQRLLGVGFHNQFFVLDPPANALSLVFSNGGTARIGA